VRAVLFIYSSVFVLVHVGTGQTCEDPSKQFLSTKPVQSAAPSAACTTNREGSGGN